MERHLLREQWFILSSNNNSVSVKSLAEQYGMEELRDYLTRGGIEINKRFLLQRD